MSVMLLAIGILVAAAGVAGTGFGIAISELPLRSSLLIAGTTALTGGLILVGLSAVINELGRVADGLRGRPRPGARGAQSHDAIIQPGPSLAEGLPGASQTAPPAPPPLPPRPRPDLPVHEVATEPYAAPAPSAVDVSAAAIERLRSSIPRADRPPARGETTMVTDVDHPPLSPNGTLPPVPPHRPAVVEPAAVESKVAADERPSGSAVDALKASRLDFLFRSRPRPAPPAQPQSFDAVWPAEGGPVAEPAEREAQPPRPDRVARQPSAGARASDTQSEEQSRTPAILKSGVVDGMAYTLYADGSIEAKLPHGTVRFDSIADLRAHIENNS